jgi:hypothetical protein
MIELTLGNPRFFRRSGPFPLAVVASTARGVADEVELLVEGVAPLQAAGPKEVSFLDNRRYASALDQTLAGALRHCSIQCPRRLQVFTRLHLWRTGRSSIRQRRSDRFL